MAFYDWNGNGKNDIQDDFIEYNIYKNSTGKSAYTSSNHSSGGKSTIWAVIGTIGILLFIGWIIGMTEPKCAHTGCDNSPASGSRYCWLHKNSSYSSYKSNSKSKSSTSSASNYGSSSNTDSSTTNTTKNSESAPSKKSYSTRSSSNKEKSKDSYNAKDYSDAEDFYEDNYDDFDGFEDAEDYYDEWGE